MWIKREIEKLLPQIAEERPSLILTGCRQAGKTSLLKRLFPKSHYVTLDLPIEAAQAEEAGEQFLKKYPSPVIIDEVQYAPQLLRFVKHAIDQNRDQNGRFFLTGSQKFQLMDKIAESLAGRCAIIDCHSLSALEYEKWAGESLNENLLWRWIWRGGYPELLVKDLAPERFFSDYLATYLERDVRQVLQVKNLRDFDRFLRLCAVRTGQLLSYDSIAGDVGVSPNTIRSWLSVLESSNIIYLLQPYFKNLGKRLVKSPKLFFLDTGLAAYLAGFRTEKELSQSNIAGAFFENHVLAQIIRYYGNRGQRAEIYFYRDHYGHEVDFVLPQGNALHLIEAKIGGGLPQKIPGFQEILKLAGSQNVLSQTLTTPAREDRWFGENISLHNSVDWGDILESKK